MTFERIVMTQSKTLLLSGLLDIELSKLPLMREDWETEEFHIEEEVWNHERNRN
jgi:hypothetical protein